MLFIIHGEIYDLANPNHQCPVTQRREGIPGPPASDLPASCVPLGVAEHDSDSIETAEDLIWLNNRHVVHTCAPGPTTSDSPPYLPPLSSASVMGLAQTAAATHSKTARTKLFSGAGRWEVSVRPSGIPKV